MTVPDTAKPLNFLWNHIDKISARANIPTSVIIELSYRCNLACPHCYLEDAEGGKHAPEISAARFCNILDQIAELGIIDTMFQGGEVFLHREWEKILAYAKQLGMYIGIKTNATLITPARLEFLRSLMPMLLVNVSVYGMDNNTYEGVTGIPNGFDKFLDAINRMKEAGISLRLNMLVTKQNLHQADLAKTWASNLGFPLYFNINVTRQVGGGIRPMAERLSTTELLDFEKKYFKQDFGSYSSCATENRYDCPMGISSFVITPYGKMNFCIDTGEPQLDVLETPVAQRWQELREHAVRIKSLMNQGCGQCSLFKGCSACAADLWQENKSFKSCSPRYKEWAEGRLS